MRRACLLRISSEDVSRRLGRRCSNATKTQYGVGRTNAKVESVQNTGCSLFRANDFVGCSCESKICIEQQIMFLCDCKCAVHLTQLSNAGVLKPVADDDVRVVVAPEEEAGELEMEVDAGAKAKPTAKGKAKARRGRKTVRFEKCSWVEVSARPQALTLVTRLLLTADDFH